MTTDFSTYKFRCHSVGKLMVGVKPPLTENQEKLFGDYDARYKGEGRLLTPKQKEVYFDLGAKLNSKPELSATAKSYLNEIHHFEFFGRSNHVTSKHIEKGLQKEAESVALYSRVTGVPIFKNKERKENEFISGEADNTFRKIRDIKSSWDLTTFPLYESKLSNIIYDWQMQGYMDLWDLHEAEIIYCLVDTPFQLIEDELRRLDWKSNILSFSGDVRDEAIPLVTELVQRHIFSKKGLEEFCQQSANIQPNWFDDFVEIPEQMRVKIFHVKRCQDKIKTLYEMIKKARKYLNDLSLQVAAEMFIEMN